MADIERLSMAREGGGGDSPDINKGVPPGAEKASVPNDAILRPKGRVLSIVDRATGTEIRAIPRVVGARADLGSLYSDDDDGEDVTDSTPAAPTEPVVPVGTGGIDLGGASVGDASSRRARRRVDDPFDRRARFRDRGRRRLEDDNPIPRSPRGPERRNGGRGGGGGDDGLDPPENGRDRGPEWETSPERGRWLVEEIVRMETTLPYEVRYNRENGPRLERLYRAFLSYVDKLQETRNDVEPYTPFSDHPVQRGTPREGLIEAMIQAHQERAERAVALEQQQAQAEPEDFTAVESLEELTRRWEDTSTPAAERPAIEEGLLKYFREAHRKGLLRRVDDTLTSLWLASQHGGARTPIGDLLMQRLVTSNQNNRPEAVVLEEAAYRLRASDPELARLNNVWTTYINWNLGKFTELMNGQTRNHREGEWRTPSAPDSSEITNTFWEPYAGYPDYYQVTARTPEQFVIAKESFLRMLKNHALGYAPDELMNNLLNFKKVFAREAERLAAEQVDLPDDSPDKMTVEFATELRQEFEGEGFIWGGAYHGEVYNKDGLKQYMTAMALHEGPQRWTRVLRSNQGRVAAPSWMLDNLPAVELAYNAQGSKGQLGRSTVAQNHFRNIIWGILIDKGAGIVLKDYDWRDSLTQSNPQIRFNRARRLHRIEAELKRNGHRLDRLQPDAIEDYRKTRSHLRRNQERLGKHQSDEAFRSLYEGFELDGNGFVTGDAHIRNYLMFGGAPAEVLAQLPESLRTSIAAGKVQNALNHVRQEVRLGRQVLARNQSALDKLQEQELMDRFSIDKKDLKAYSGFFDKAKANFNIAMEMQMVQQEHTIRGGGVYFIYKNRFVRDYHTVRQADDAKLTERERAGNWTKDQYLGWILDEIKKGRSIDSFTPNEQRIYNDPDLSEEDKKNDLDQVPVHQAIKAVQAVANWTKMKYADDAPIWQRQDLAEIINAKDENGHYTHPNFRAQFRTAVINRAIKLATEQVWGDGFQARFYDIDYDAEFDHHDTGKFELRARVDAEGNPAYEPMMFKVPEGTINPQTGKMDVQRTVPVHLDFDRAVNSYLALHTTHTYWAYQSNNTHTINLEYVINQAKDIRDGKLRPEDADIFAGLLLTLDPTLSRVKRFDGDQMAIEALIFDALVEESFQTWIDAKNSLKEAFLPRDGNTEFMQTGYYTEDQGGEARFSTMVEALVAKMPKRWARRFSAALAITPMYATTMADSLGRKGVIGAVSLMEDSIHETSGQRILGQFGITKFVNLIDRSSQLWFALVGGVDPKTGLHHEGIFMKPTNNSDKLQKYFGNVQHTVALPAHEDEFFYDMRETFGRVEAALKIIRAMYSDDRNSGGALDLRETDMYLPDGRVNPDITTESERNTGSSRHIARMFWNAYVDWLMDDGPGGGSAAYPQEASYFKHLKDPIQYDIQLGMKKPRTIADWLFDKMAL